MYAASGSPDSACDGRQSASFDPPQTVLYLYAKLVHKALSESPGVRVKPPLG